MSQLLPCPFCGGGAVKWREARGNRTYAAASCLSDACAASNWKLPLSTWNRRVPVTATSVSESKPNE